MKIECSVGSHVGLVRGNNEDNFYLNGSWRRDVDEQKTNIIYLKERKRLLAAVFDGMGGESKGELASHEAAKILSGYQSASFQQIITDYIEAVNNSICDMTRDYEVGRMGSTLALIEIEKGKLNVCNLGDSPIFMYRDGVLKKISVDHNEAQRMVDMGVMTKEECMKSPRKFRLTQHLGVFKEELILEPYIKEGIALQKGDIIMACSDGLTDMLDVGEIESVLCKSQSIDWMVRDLIDDALKKGGRDNVTVVLAQLTSKWL